MNKLTTARSLTVCVRALLFYICWRSNNQIVKLLFQYARREKESNYVHLFSIIMYAAVAQLGTPYTKQLCGILSAADNNSGRGNAHQGAFI
jgi:hypothetical protein